MVLIFYLKIFLVSLKGFLTRNEKLTTEISLKKPHSELNENILKLHSHENSDF